MAVSRWRVTLRLLLEKAVVAEPSQRTMLVDAVEDELPSTTYGATRARPRDQAGVYDPLPRPRLRPCPEERGGPDLAATQKASSPIRVVGVRMPAGVLLQALEEDHGVAQRLVERTRGRLLTTTKAVAAAVRTGDMIPE